MPEMGLPNRVDTSNTSADCVRRHRHAESGTDLALSFSIEEPRIKTSLLHVSTFQEYRGKLSLKIASMDLGELCASDNTSKIPLIAEDVTLKANRQVVEICLNNLEK